MTLTLFLKGSHTVANQAFSTSALARCLSRADFYDDPRLSDESFRKSVLDYALQLSQCDHDGDISIKKIKLGDKVGYTSGNIASKLVLRRCKKNIQAAFKISTSNRQAISREIPIYLKEGTCYKIYRLDIKSFFETIPTDTALSIIDNNQKLSSQTKAITRKIIKSFEAKYGPGIPRGIEISPAISELLLLEYDYNLRTHEEIFYFSRFVDDVLIITSSNEVESVFYKWLCEILPSPLTYNTTKTKIYPVPLRKKAGIASPHGKLIVKFSFLGYCYTVYDTPLPKKPNGTENENTVGSIYRKVSIEIDDKKIKKMKERICKSLFSFSKSNDFDLLHDRIKFLTSNRELKNKDADRRIPTGIYYNYSSIDSPSTSLKELDCFLEKILTSTSGRFSRTYSGKLNKARRATLLKLTFSSGFEKRAHRKFSPNKLKEITRIWL